MKAAYLPLYVRDWRSDPKVALLPWTERALYLDMLLLSWELGPLPADAAAILRAIGWDLDPAEGVAAVGRILARCWKRAKAGWTNPRLERERARTEEIAARRSHVGRLGAQAKHAPRCAVGDAVGTTDGTAVGRPDCTTDGMPRAPEPEPEPLPSTPESLKTDSPSLRSGEGASAPEGPPGAEKPRVQPGPARSAGLFEIKPPKGKAEPTQNQVDGFVARAVWQRCWKAKFGKAYAGLTGQKSSAVRFAFVRLGRDEGELERLVRAYLDNPPFKDRQNPNPSAFLDALDAVRAGLNGKGGHRPTARERFDADVREGLDEVNKLFGEKEFSHGSA